MQRSLIMVRLLVIAVMLIANCITFGHNCEDRISDIIDGFEIDSTECNFGDILPGKLTLKHTFNLYNHGKNDLDIKYVYKSCSCLTYKLSNHILKSGGSSQLEVLIDLRGEGKGYFCHKLTVAIEGAKRPLILTIKGKIGENVNHKI